MVSKKKKSEVEDHFGSDSSGFKMPASNTEVNTNKSKPKPKGENLEVTKSEENEESSEEEKELTYSERLEALDISEEKAIAIIDDLCEKGSYLDKFIVRKAREGKEAVKVVFSTRDSRSQGYIIDRISKLKNLTPIAYNKLMGELQLAASIVHFNSVNFPSLIEIKDEEDFKEEILKRVEYFSTLAAPIIVVLINKLSKFDLEVASVMAPGYEDFF